MTVTEAVEKLKICLQKLRNGVERVVEPRLGVYRGEVPAESGGGVTAEEARGLRLALYALLASVVVIALLIFPPGAPLRDQQTRAILGVIPKWALHAPIFVPLFMKLGVAPEAVLAAYRVGDSPPNVVTPLMPYFALIVVFAQRYDKNAGVGTVVTMMLPFAVAVSSY